MKYPRGVTTYYCRDVVFSFRRSGRAGTMLYNSLYDYIE